MAAGQHWHALEDICKLLASTGMLHRARECRWRALPENLLRKHGAFCEDTALKADTPVPSGPLWQSVYIDDKAVIYRLPFRDLHKCEGWPDCDLVGRGAAAYAAEPGATSRNRRDRTSRS